MTRLIFQTPSKRCPLRHHNGEPVGIDFECGKSFVRRIGQRAMIYGVTFPLSGESGFAIADELFLLPDERTP